MNVINLTPYRYMKGVQNGEISNEWWCLPLFLFDEALVQRDTPTAGIFCGYVLVRVSTSFIPMFILTQTTTVFLSYLSR